VDGADAMHDVQRVIEGGIAGFVIKNGIAGFEARLVPSSGTIRQAAVRRVGDVVSSETVQHNAFWDTVRS